MKHFINLNNQQITIYKKNNSQSLYDEYKWLHLIYHSALKNAKHSKYKSNNI